MEIKYHTQEFDSIPMAIYFINTDPRINEDKSNLIGNQLYWDNGSHLWYVVWSEEVA